MIRFHPSHIELIDQLGNEARVVNCARVSFNKQINENEDIKEQDKKLIEYLIKHGHESPFFHLQFTFRFKMPIFIARQWWRHTVGFSRNEVSRRYIDTSVECCQPVELRRRHPNKKQGSLEETVEKQKEQELLKKIEDHCVNAMELYDELIDDGVCPEQARMILPLNLYTEFYETGSFAGYMRIIKQRCSPDAQKEIREYAEEVLRILRLKVPILVEAFEKYNKI